MMRRSPFGDTKPRREQKFWTADELPGPRVPLPVVRREIPMACEPIEKEDAIQHEGYMATVRTFACARCGWYAKGLIQFCHADQGKGAGIKTDCRRGWPGCAPHDGLPGCHWIVGTSGRLPKAERREFEEKAGAQTRALVIAAGAWPARLPRWSE